MKINKRIVAREGLIIITILLLLGITFFIKQYIDEENAKNILGKSSLIIYDEKRHQWVTWTSILNKINILLIAVYPAYLVIRFVAWSIKTLRIRS